MQALSHLGWVFLGGGIGSSLRYGVGRAAALWARGSAWMTATYVIGCVVLSIGGLFAGMAVMRGLIAS